LGKLTIRAVPRAFRTEIVSYVNGVLKIRLKALPVDGAANEELVKFLSKLFNVPKTDVKITFGFTSKNKIVSIAELGQSALEGRLSRFNK
jgi:uncharacterized protein (TIGR00251 family)